MVRFFTTSQLKNKVAFGETYVKKCERGKQNWPPTRPRRFERSFGSEIFH